MPGEDGPRLQGIQYLWGMAEETIGTSGSDKPWRFKKGNPGKQPGTQARLTRTVKETLLEVFNECQENPKTSLKAFADKYPRDFYNMAAKLIPTEITGPNGEKFEVTLKLK